jgi:hypothetical protein
MNPPRQNAKRADAKNEITCLVKTEKKKSRKLLGFDTPCKVWQLWRSFFAGVGYVGRMRRFEWGFGELMK